MAGVISTQGFTFRLMAGEPATQLDLFADEDYVLSNNVTGLFDIGLLPSDFTRQITLPGTKINNAFFQHCYDISIDNPLTFATNQKVPAYFEFDSIYLSNGYLQLNKVNIIANKFIDSYEITIYGTLSSFGRDINKLYLTDLASLQKYNHTSSYDNIVSSWSGSLFGGDIVYPMADYGAGWTFNTRGDVTGINSNLGAMNVQDFKPAIRVKAVWDAIFEETGYTYSSSFWAQDYLQDLYMICNTALKYPEYSDVDLEQYGIMKISAIPSSSGVPGNTNLNLPDSTVTQLPWLNVQSDPQGFVGTNSSYRVEKNTRLQGILNLSLNVSASVNNMPSSWRIHYWPTGSIPASGSYTVLPDFNNYFDQLVQSRNGSVNQTYEVSTPFYTSVLSPGSYYFGLYQAGYYISPTPTVTIDPSNNPKSFLNITKVNQAADGKVIDIPSNMPYGTTGIRLIDFITGLQKKFNLVIYPNKNKLNEFIVETFNSWYNKGEVKDFNKYVNLDKNIEVIFANNLAVNKLSFADTLDTDYIAQQFFKGANREYGKTYYNDTTNYYSQGELNVKTTFGNGPLLQIAGTGLSGSAEGIAPIPSKYSIGTYKVSYVSSAGLVCGNYAQSAFYQLYTDDGTFASGKIVYLDAYGNNAVTGYTYLVKSVPGSQIYTLSSSTGTIGSGTGQYC